MQCKECRFSHPTGDAQGNLQCRRLPPSVSPVWAYKQVVEQRIQLKGAGEFGGEAGLLPVNSGFITVWPTVKPGEWCGEFAPVKLD